MKEKVEGEVFAQAARESCNEGNPLQMKLI